jgi:hypothetical protein
VKRTIPQNLLDGLNEPQRQDLIANENLINSSRMSMLQTIENSILVIRGVPVLLDGEIAKFYDVETKRINEAVKNNPDKFPPGYVVSLSKGEWENLRSKFSTSSWGGQRYVPTAFTEKGLYMLATILKSPKATQTTLAIIEAFAKIRELGRNIKELADTTSDTDKKRLMQRAGEVVTDIFADDLAPLESETTLELNFAVLKFKHTIKRDRKKKPKK